jgi:hypothetical protein
VGICLRVNQLHIDPHLIARFLHATLNNVRYSKLLGDLGEIARFLIVPRGSAGNYFQVRDASQSGQDLLLDAVGEISVIWVGTEIFKRQNCDSVCYRMPDQFTSPNIPPNGRS